MIDCLVSVMVHHYTNRSDAMVVLKNGKTGIGLSNPQHRLGSIKYHQY